MRKRGEIITMPIGRRIKSTAFALCLSNHFGFAEELGLTGKTFQSLVSISAQALAKGEYAYAADIFDALEHEYGDDAEYAQDSFQKVITPIRGYAQLMSGRPEEAIDTLNGFLKKYPDTERKKEFAFFNLGHAYEEANKLRMAMDTYRQFEQWYPGKTEVAVAMMRRAEILFKMENHIESIELFNTLYATNAAYTLRIQARLRALQHCLAIDDIDAAKLILFNTEWSVSTMPELAMLAFSVLRIDDILLAVNDGQSAIHCYRLTPPKNILVKAQEKRLKEIQAVYQKRTPLIKPSSNSVWADYYRRLIFQIESQLEELKKADDYTPGFLLRYGQALLLADRPREAWTVFEWLATDSEFNEETRTTAHYRWIIAAGALEYWDNALQLANQFTKNYPFSPLVPKALFLVAEADRGLHDYQQAIKILTELIDKYPAHSLSFSWRFNRGFCQLLDERFANARDDFKRFLNEYPSDALTVNARFWHAQCQFFEKKYSSALSEFDALAVEVKRHPLVPEISYRRASILYATRNYDKALTEINRYLNDYFRHQRYHEALVLKGDILMGKGELLAAKKSF